MMKMKLGLRAGCHGRIFLEPGLQHFASAIASGSHEKTSRSIAMKSAENPRQPTGDGAEADHLGAVRAGQGDCQFCFDRLFG